jgi:hypothetical protein
MLINLLTGAGNDANVTVNIQGLPLDDAAVQWIYSGSGTSAPTQSNVGGVGNSFTYSIAPRTLIVLLIPPSLSGDFNRDGIVDAADYSVWRHMLNQNVVNGAGADGDGNGLVDQADYAIWKANFGNAAPGQGSAQAGTNIPAPPSQLLLILCSILAVAFSRTRPHTRGHAITGQFRTRDGFPTIYCRSRFVQFLDQSLQLRGGDVGRSESAGA